MPPLNRENTGFGPSSITIQPTWVNTVALRVLSCALLLMLSAACGEEDAPQDETNGAGMLTVSPDSGTSSDASCSQGSTISCVCTSGGLGQQICSAGNYGGCEGCVASNNPGVSKCVAGVYRGHLDMSYGSTASGLCGIIGPLAKTDYPGDFLFSLEQNGSLEFYTVGNGCLQVPPPPDPMAYDIKFRAALTGNVNCATGELKLGVKATYGVVSVCNLGQIRDQYYAKGSITAMFDPTMQTFKGTMDLMEPKVLIGEQPGGTGTFSASLDPSATIASTGDCLEGVQFPDEKFADAGTP